MSAHDLVDSALVDVNASHHFHYKRESLTALRLFFELIEANNLCPLLIFIEVAP